MITCENPKGLVRRCKVCGCAEAEVQPFEFLPEERLCRGCLRWLDDLLKDHFIILTGTGKLIQCPF